ncbi:MAG: hypothetical protein ACFCBU_00125, partial [Cyanophyceae cyanobacterium]
VGFFGVWGLGRMWVSCVLGVGFVGAGVYRRRPPGDSPHSRCKIPIGIGLRRNQPIVIPSLNAVAIALPLCIS